jgi:hypothetical protein
MHCGLLTVAEYVNALIMPPPLVDWQVPFTSNAPKRVPQAASEKKLIRPAVQVALAWQVQALHDS